MNILLTDEKKASKDIEIVILKNFRDLKKDITKKLINIGFSIDSLQAVFLDNVCYVGTELFSGECFKISICNAIQKIETTKFQSIYINLVQSQKELNLEDLLEGCVLGNYVFNKYKSVKKQDKKTLKIDISSSKQDKNELFSKFEQKLIVLNSVNMVRDFVNTTPEDFTPSTMAQEAKNISKANNLDCKIYGEEYLVKNGMNAMLAVGRASRHESQLVHISYKPKNPKGKVILVGKGLTYDCGGLSLKESGGLSMKCDKSAGCAILGIMNCLTALNCQYEVHGIIGAVENMIGGDSYKPDDVLVAKNGKTIEVRNTDAEGRLVLADCLCYAQDEINDIDYIIDMATLTGASIVALGDYSTAVMGHSDKLKKKILKASSDSGELIGILPFNRYLLKKMDSKIADITNYGSSRSGGAIIASVFLDNFIKKENKKKWLHLDMAGASYKEESWGYNPYGASGAGVRLILSFINKLK